MHSNNAHKALPATKAGASFERNDCQPAALCRQHPHLLCHSTTKHLVPGSSSQSLIFTTRGRSPPSSVDIFNEPFAGQDFVTWKPCSAT